MGQLIIGGQIIVTNTDNPTLEARGREFPFDRSHGSLFDRGSADSYYRRVKRAHYGGVGGDSGPEVLIFDEDTQAQREYLAGYEWNEAQGTFDDRFYYGEEF